MLYVLCITFGFALGSTYSAKIVKQQKNIFRKESDK